MTRHGVGVPTPSEELEEILGADLSELTEAKVLMAEGYKRCQSDLGGCGEVKEVEEFYVHGNGKPGSTGTWMRGICKDCENSKPRLQTSARVIRTRARNRATARLVKLHPTQFQMLLDEEQQLAEAEAVVLQHLAAGDLTQERPVATLRPGPRRAGQDVTQRIDVATCRRCHTHHDRGHACPKCGHTTEEGAP